MKTKIETPHERQQLVAAARRGESIVLPLLAFGFSDEQGDIFTRAAVEAALAAHNAKSAGGFVDCEFHGAIESIVGNYESLDRELETDERSEVGCVNARVLLSRERGIPLLQHPTMELAVEVQISASHENETTGERIIDAFEIQGIALTRHKVGVQMVPKHADVVTAVAVATAVAAAMPAQGGFAAGVSARSTPTLVIIEHPFKAATPEDRTRNARYLKLAMRDSLSRGEAPYASVLLYATSGVLHDDIPEQRTQGIDAGLAWGARAALTAVYTDFGVSAGMEIGIARARGTGRPVEYRQIENVNDLLMMLAMEETAAAGARVAGPVG